MSETGYSRIENILIEAGLISPDQLAGLITEKKRSKKRLPRLLIEKGLVSEDRLHSLIEEKLNIPLINLNDYPIDPKMAGSIPPETAMKLKVIPISKKKGRIILAMSDPLDLAAVDEVAMITGSEIYPVMASESSINHMIIQIYGFKDNISSDKNIKKHDLNNLQNKEVEEVVSAPVVRMVSSLIDRAIEEGASDIHLEPAADKLRIRLRLDGVLHDIPSPPNHSQAHIISRIKILANLDIAERRLPQDGNIEWEGSKKSASLRISTLPTVHGEKIVIRILEKDKIVLPLDQLGFSKNNYSDLLRLLINQNGLLLITGPTGSGKTTSLYSALNYLNKPEVNIVTVEDPVEFQLDGINQVQVNPRINRKFVNSLRSILRQDPDIIMVGEIRDLETARITLQAAMTGHLVLSTLHTNNAASAVTRLVDMGLEDYLVSASMVGVIAQRLVRTICSHCKTDYTPETEEKYFFKRFFGKEAPAKLSHGSECRHCNHTGYRGRTSIQEVLVINRELKELIMAGASAEIIQQKAVDMGMRTLIDDGLRCIEAGRTTIGEIVRTTYSSIFDTSLTGNTRDLTYLARLRNNDK